jgi:hypothetical protein
MNLTPEPDEIVQTEEDPYDVRPIAVATCGPVETRELPGIRAGYKTETGVGTTVAVRILALEPRRKSATVFSVDQAIWIGSSQAAAQAGGSTAFYLPAATRFVIDHMDEVWVCAAAATTSVSVMSTFWSE